MKKKDSPMTQIAIETFIDELERLLNSDTEYSEEIKKWLGVDDDECITITKSFYNYDKLYRLNHIYQTVNKMGKCSKVVDLSVSKNTHPTKVLVELFRKKKTPLYLRAHSFYTMSENKTRLIIKTNFSENEGGQVSMLCHPDNKDECEKLFNELLDSFEKNHPLKGEKFEMTSQGQINLLEFDNKVWEHIILAEDIEQEIKEQLLYPLDNIQKFKKAKIPLKRGILLTGLPGTGKSTLGKILCNTRPETIMWLSGRNFDAEGYGLSTAFEVARLLAPSIVFFEDIDFIGGERVLGNTTAVLSELLNQLDGITSNEGVFTIATTNHKEMLDEAIKNRPARFDIIIDFEVFGDEERKRYFDYQLTNVNHELTQGDLLWLVSQTKGFVGAHLEEIIVQAKQLSLMKEDKVCTIKREYLEDVLVKFKKRFTAHGNDKDDAGYYG